MKPSKEYTIHILEDEDFDMLPVGKPKEALGMTDPERKIAWVRRTHVKDLDLGTINHEFDELMAGTSLHEEDGIRYKGFAAIIPILKAIGVFGAKAAGTALVAKGVGNTLSTGNPFKSPKAPSININAPSQSPFAPQPAAGAQASAGPLSEQDFNKGLGNIDNNLNQRLTNIGRLFRGQEESGNTAFKSQAESARTNALSSREDFIKRQDDAKRVAGVF